MMHFLIGIDRASALAERILAEDDAKHRVLGEPSHPKFLTAPPKRIDTYGQESTEAQLRKTVPAPRPEIQHSFRDRGAPIK